MSRMAIVTDIDRCTGCLACTVACKVVHPMPIGKVWCRPLRVGPYPIEGGSGNWPDVDMYFLNVTCQHCENPQCVEVCPTGASVKLDDGTVQIHADQCIGCQLCIQACPYEVRYLNDETNVVEKCTLCHDEIESGEFELPRCVSQCCGMSRWYGDLDEGIESFKGPRGATLGEYLQDFDDSQIYSLPDSGNGPTSLYILRKQQWQGADKTTWEGLDFKFVK